MWGVILFPITLLLLYKVIIIDRSPIYAKSIRIKLSGKSLEEAYRILEDAVKKVGKIYERSPPDTFTASLHAVFEKSIKWRFRVIVWIISSMAITILGSLLIFWWMQLFYAHLGPSSVQWESIEYAQRDFLVTLLVCLLVSLTLTIKLRKLTAKFKMYSLVRFNFFKKSNNIIIEVIPPPQTDVAFKATLSQMIEAVGTFIKSYETGSKTRLSFSAYS